MKNPFRQIRVFSTETIGELKKASWPTKKELKDYTLVVVLAVIIIGVYISLADYSLVNWVDFLTRWVRSN
jgi:preprotein translocase subunit SecE